ncbi:hypothetical protein SSX86_001058 [Deinandra increscens subsp. villosa]|uniref:Uncharacterized protein n=1 Tax=Deinandra increscens subsp. villosa TaxID=3103831 RepID=A0AAP0DUN6_9ASTR
MSTRSGRRLKSLKLHAAAPPPPPTPAKIINLPRRYCVSGRRRKSKEAEVVVLDVAERRRERVEAEEGGGGGGEERWRFQAEILRAECRVLRMERKVALKKLERNRVRIETTLKSALENLASGRKKLCEGKNMEMVLEEEMKELAEKLEELQSSYNGSEDRELRKCKNFDKKALCLQRRLEKLGGLPDDESNNKDRASIHRQYNREVNKDNTILTFKSQTKSTDVGMLEKKMEGLSKGMVRRMEEEYGSILNSSVASSASTSKRIDFPDHLSFSNRFSNHTEEPLVSKESSSRCSGRCKMLVRRIVEQVRAETEQWSQMQDMLGKLRQEMEELQASKNFWETQAHASNQEIQTLISEVEEWREKALGYEMKANSLQTEVSLVKNEVEKLKKDQVKEVSSTPKKAISCLSKQIERDTKNGLSCRMNGECDVIGSKRHETVEQSMNDSHPLSLAKQLAREKRILISRPKENHRPKGNENPSDRRRKGYNLVRSPFKDIGNSSSSSSAGGGAIRQNSNAVFPLHYLEGRME